MIRVPRAGAGVRAQEHEARAQAAQDPLQVEQRALGAPVVAAGGRVQDRHRALRDAQRRAQPGHVRRGRPLRDVVARQPYSSVVCRPGRVDPLPGQGGVPVAGRHVVPPVDVPQQLRRSPCPGRRGALQQIEARVPQRGCPAGSARDLPGPLAQPPLEGGVGDQVAGAGQCRPVGGRAGPQPARAQRNRDAPGRAGRSTPCSAAARAPGTPPPAPPDHRAPPRR